MAAGAAAVLGLLPGLPTLPFLAIAGLAGGAAWMRQNTRSGLTDVMAAPPAVDGAADQPNRCGWT